MEFFHKNQKMILGIVLIVAVFYFYTIFFKTDGLAVVTPQDLTAQQVGASVLELSSKLKKVDLDQSLFTQPLYKKLVDFSAPIPDQQPGRSNPFNVIGLD